MDLNQVTMPVTDLSRSIAFYERLGLTLIVRAEDRYARFELPFGNATFSLHHAPEVRTPTGVVVYFECEDLDERVALLVESGIVFDTPPTDQPWLWREAYTRDPDGHVICLFRAGTHRHNPPWRIRSEADE